MQENSLSPPLKPAKFYRLSYLEKHLQFIKENFSHSEKNQQNHSPNNGISLENNLKSLPQKKKRKRAPRKIRCSLIKLHERHSLIEKMYSPNETEINLAKPSNSKKQLETKNNIEPLEKNKELKILSFETKHGVMIRGRLVNSECLKDVKKNFFPLSQHALVLQNRKKLNGIPKIKSISDIKEKDPFKWGREQAGLQNEEKMGIHRFYTRKLKGYSFEEKNNRESDAGKMNFSKEIKEKTPIFNEEKGVFEPKLKKKKHQKKDQKIILPSLFLVTVKKT